MAEGAESVEASTPATDETTTITTTATTEAAAAVTETEDKTTAASASTIDETGTETPPSVAESAKETEDEVVPETAATSPSAGEKRKADADADPSTESKDTTTTTDAAVVDTAAPAAETKPKKARIAMPPKVSSSLMDVEKYKLESPPPEDNTNEADVIKKITTANLMLFGLHPLIKEGPLQKMLEDYGTVQAITVRSAFASRYGHISFETVEEARKCYVAIHGAKLLHKAFLVQPSMASAVSVPAPAPGASAGAAAAAATATDTSAGAAAAAAAVTTTSS